MKSEPYFLAPFAVEEVNALIDAANGFKVPKLPKRERGSSHNDVRVIEVMGPLVRRQTWMAEILGWTTYEETIRSIEAAVNDAQTAAIVLVIDSPGGIASGCLECAEAVSRASKEKPVIAMVDGVGTSAAYFIASGATKIIAAPDSWIGSIGTVFELRNFAELERRMGIETTVITTGDFKAAGHRSHPMTEPVRDYFAGLVEKMGQHFTEHVSKFRKLSESQRKEVTSAKVYTADDAQRLGLIDGVGFTAEVIDTLLNRTTDDPRQVGHSLATVMANLQFDRMEAARQESQGEEFWDAVDLEQDQRGCTRAEAMRVVQRNESMETAGVLLTN